MAQHHDVADVRVAIRRMITIWAACQPGTLSYLGGVALEENILDLIRDLGSDPAEGQSDAS